MLLDGQPTKEPYNRVETIMPADLTFSADDLRELAIEALESGDIETAQALAQNAEDTEEVESNEQD